MHHPNGGAAPPMARTLLALVICLLVQFPNRTCLCGAAEHAHPADADGHVPHEHHDDCPAAQPIPKWKGVKPVPAELPPADAGPVAVIANHVLRIGPAEPFAPAAPPPPGVPIYLSVCALRN